MGAKQDRLLEERRRETKAHLSLEYERVTGKALPIEYITAHTVTHLRVLLRRAKRSKEMEKHG